MDEKVIFYTNNTLKSYTNIDLLNVLVELGIENNDQLCIHSALNFGKPAFKSKNDYMNELLNTIKYAIGSSGIIIMPTFTYSFCKNEIFDVNNSESTVGIFTEYFRKIPGSIRTEEPIFSHSIYGVNKEAYAKINDSCFGKNSVFDILVQNNAKLVFFGDNLGFTFIHYIEEYVKTILQYNLDYRYFKNFSGKILKSNNIITERTIRYLVRDPNKIVATNVKYFKYLLVKNKILKETSFGNSTIAVANFTDILNFGIYIIKKEPLIFVLN